MRFEKLLSEVSAVADRDLRVQAEVTADTLGVVADCIQYLIYELAKLVILTQKTTAYVTDMSQSMLSSVYQQLEEIESISLAIQTPDRKAIEDIKTSLNVLYTSTTNLTTRLGYIQPPFKSTVYFSFLLSSAARRYAQVRNLTLIRSGNISSLWFIVQVG